MSGRPQGRGLRQSELRCSNGRAGVYPGKAVDLRNLAQTVSRLAETVRAERNPVDDFDSPAPDDDDEDQPGTGDLMMGLESQMGSTRFGRPRNGASNAAAAVREAQRDFTNGREGLGNELALIGRTDLSSGPRACQAREASHALSEEGAAIQKRVAVSRHLARIRSGCEIVLWTKRRPKPNQLPHRACLLTTWSRPTCPRSWSS